MMTVLSDDLLTRSPALVRRYSLKMVILIALAGAATLPPFLFLSYASLHRLDASGGKVLRETPQRRPEQV